MWKVSSSSDFDDWFAGLAPAIQVEVIAVVKLLQVVGPALRRPHCDTLSGSRHPNMKELRVSTADHVLRIAFAFDPTRSAILLCAGNKSGVNQRRFYNQLIARADSLYDAHLKRLRKTHDRK